jgi:FMN-dependent NADH-azoreductase
MTTLLHISASPRGEQSESLALAGEFLDTLGQVHPEIEVAEWDLWDGSLPDFGPHSVAAKMAVFAGQEPEGQAGQAWHATKRAFERFASADIYLFSVPMWNHGIPYILKQLIDVVSQPGLVFGFDPVHGYTGLLAGKRAVVLYTSAVYGEGIGSEFGFDAQKPYFEGWLRWAGIDDIQSVEFRPTFGPGVEERRLAAQAAANDAAKTLVP